MTRKFDTSHSPAVAAEIKRRLSDPHYDVKRQLQRAIEIIDIGSVQGPSGFAKGHKFTNLFPQGDFEARRKGFVEAIERLGGLSD